MPITGVLRITLTAPLVAHGLKVVTLSGKWCDSHAVTEGLKSKYGTLTLNPLTWKIWRAPNNTSRWQMEFNSAFQTLTEHQFNRRSGQARGRAVMSSIPRRGNRTSSLPKYCRSALPPPLPTNLPFVYAPG